MKYKKFISAIIILLLVSINAFSSVKVSIIDIKINDKSIIPKYSSNLKKYYLKNCDKKIYKLDFILSNKKIIKKIVILKENEGRSVTALNKKYEIFCLKSEFSKFDYDFINYKEEKGYVVIDKDRATIIYDNKGNIIWFREYNNYLPYFSSIDKNGVLTSILFNITLKENKHALLSNNIAGSHIIKFDLKDNSIKKTITPFEFINGVKKFPPIDFHGFYEVNDGYYLISYLDSYINKIPKDYVFDVEDKNMDKVKELCDNSGKDILIRKPRIIKVDYTGEVIWSYEVDIKPDNNFISLSLYKNQQEADCVIDVNHPNHISTDESEEIISIGMRNNSILLIKKDKDIIGALGYNYNNLETDILEEQKNDNIKNFTYEGDSYGGICSTHSGFISKKKIIVFDNRCYSNESSRAVIYNLDYKKLIAKFEKSFLLSDNLNNCYKSNVGKISCNSKNMGAGRFVDNEYILINWGEVDNSRAVLSIFNNKYQKILEILGPKIDNQNKPLYISNYYNEKSFSPFIKSLESISMGKSADILRDEELITKIKKSI